MAVDVHSRTKAFLEEAANKYATQSPSVAAHLMLSHHALPSNSKNAQHDRGACRACGTVLLPGVTTKTTTESSVGSRKKAKRDGEGDVPVVGDQHAYVKVECLACHRYEKYPLEKKHANDNKQGRLQSSLAHRSGFAVNDDATRAVAEKRELGVSANRSSKQRAKTRKQGLQAMVKRSEEQSGKDGGFGLRLMDLMKAD